jgi:hypothetical protein
MRKLLEWIAARPVLSWAGLAVYGVAVTLPHGVVQDWLAVQVRPIGLAAFYRMMAGVALVAGGLASWSYARAMAGHTARRELVVAWVVALGRAAGAWQWLTVNNSELVHFGQYFLPGFVLMGLTGRVTESLAWIAMLAGADEGYQFWGLHADWGIPWDFNDIFIDLVGGILGVLWGFAYLPVRRRESARSWGVGSSVLLGVLGVGFVLWLLGLLLIFEDKSNTSYWFSLSRLAPKGFWFFDETWGPRRIHALTPLEGLALVLGTRAAYGWLDARYEVKRG